MTVLLGISAAGASPLLRSALGEVWSEIGARRRQNAFTALAVAASEAQTDPDDLIARARADDERLALFSEALAAATATLNSQKVAALGLALGSGLLHDDAEVDEERMVVRALSEIEQPHLRVMARLPSEVPKVHTAGKPLPRFARPSFAEEVILGVLARNGLAESNKDDVDAAIVDYGMEQLESGRPGRHLSWEPTGEVAWFSTTFGDLCLDYLRGGERLVGSDAWPEGRR